MSGRYNDHKGSSRSTRDDSRLSRERHERKRSRSRSPRRRHSPKGRETRSPSPPHPPKYSSDRRDKHRRDKRERKRSGDSSEEEVPAPPPPPRITKISIGFNKPKAPIKMSLSGPAKPSVSKPTVASVFTADDDDEPEQMPAEARMRMRNIGRETPTSAGPNSFGKTKQGFCDAKKVFEKNLKQALETADKPTPKMKFPQTIYKIGP